MIGGMKDRYNQQIMDLTITLLRKKLTVLEIYNIHES